MFSQKLKEAMEELKLNQTQLAGLIGKSKGSVSQYLSGTQIPPEEKQKEIAVSLGLTPDYFAQEDSVAELLSWKNEVIPRLQVKTAAKLLQMAIRPWKRACSKECSPGDMESIHQKIGGHILSTHDGLLK